MRKYIYPALFTPEDGGYTVRFPDLEGCYTEGDTLEEAYDMARDVLCHKLYHLELDALPIPAPSAVVGLATQAQDGSFVSLVDADTLEYRKYYDNKAVKKTLTLPSWLNTAAEQAGMNFSQILQDALKDQLHIG